MGNLRVKRVSYIRRNGELIPRKKTIFEKLENDCYRVVEYDWIRDKNKNGWIVKGSSGYYDGETLHETGHVYLANKDLDRLFELMVKYSGYEYMKDDEVNTSADEELAKIKQFSRYVEEK